MSEPNSYFDKSFDPNFFNGLIAKRHFNNFTLRLGIEYVKNFEKTDNSITCNDCMHSDGYTNEGMIRLGIEKGILINNYFRPYLALDLTGIKSYSEKTLRGGIMGINEEHKTNQNGFGAMPTIGFEFLLTKYLSIAIETRLQLMHIKTIDRTYSLYDNSTYVERQYSESRTTVNRIGALTLNFNF